MFIRQTKTSNATSGKPYFTFRLVASKRIDSKVRQQTLLNLGRNFSLPKEQWPDLCARIEQLVSEQTSFVQVSDQIENMAQRYAARLVVALPPEASVKEAPPPEYHEVDIDSIEYVRPRSIGVEHAGLEALKWLDFPHILKQAGFNGIQQAAAIGSVVGRMAAPGSELAIKRWLDERSGLGELLDMDF